MFSIFFTESALKELAGIPQRDRDYISLKIEKLRTYPQIQFRIKKLGGFDATFRIRVGNFRVFFEIDGAKQMILITQVDDRKDAYR